MGIEIRAIPPAEYEDYRMEAIFKAYKWDPQCEDTNTVSRSACLLSRKTAVQLEKWAEELSVELLAAEQVLLDNLSLCKDINLDRRVVREFRDGRNKYEPALHVRLMRYDFHPVMVADEGGRDTLSWALSEVNSDVPCGFAESVLMPELAEKFFPGYCVRGNVADALCRAFTPKLERLATKRIAYIHATSYSDDRQVLQYLHDYFEQRGVEGVFAAPDLIGWDKGDECRGFTVHDKKPVGGIIRSFPAEWLYMFPKKCRAGYFNSTIAQCNHPAAVLTQSKRLPLIWARLEREHGLKFPTWRKLLPETVSANAVPGGFDPEKWIYKFAMGRVGDGILMKGVTSAKDEKGILKAVKSRHQNWAVQRKFVSRPLGEDGLHLCVGVFVVDGKAAGFFGRASNYNLIDSCAADIPVLVQEEEERICL
jgi:glutathionylspermidine synthase